MVIPTELSAEHVPVGPFAIQAKDLSGTNAVLGLPSMGQSVSKYGDPARCSEYGLMFPRPKNISMVAEESEIWARIECTECYGWT